MHFLYFLVSTVGALVVVTVSRGMICPVMGRVVNGFCTTYLFVKYIRQKKVSSMMKVKVFEETRSCAALRAADLDWIVGPEYSLGGYIFGDCQLLRRRSL